MSVIDKVKSAKEASYNLSNLSAEDKNRILLNIADKIDKNRDKILEANKRDLKDTKKVGISQQLYKRLILNDEKIDEIINGINNLVALKDPIGKKIMRRELAEDLILEQITVPIGVIGIIFESRPDALVQISTLCIKTGNSVILKGGAESLYTNEALYKIIVDAATEFFPIFKNALVLFETREDVTKMLELDSYIDLIIPRGSNSLVKFIRQNTKIPVLGHSDGICHTYIDKLADLDKSINIVYDAKCQYPAVCNALETLLVHKDIAEEVLPKIKSALSNVELRGCEKTLKIIDVLPASDSDWDLEYNDLILSIKIVDNLDEAIDFINRHGSHHTDCIITDDRVAAKNFLDKVDSASVFQNCSTRFADGYRYGFGAEVGISTNKIHARGPVGMNGLTITKYILKGTGHIVGDFVSGKKKWTHKDLEI